MVTVALLTLQGLDDPSANEFLVHPDFRQIASFFLGWVFLSSMHHLFYSPFSRYVVSRVILWLYRRSANTGPVPNESTTLEAQMSSPDDEKPRRWAEDVASEVIFPKNQYPALVFTMTLLFALASIAQFASLLSFSPTSGGAETTCAFVVAWGGMSSQSARLVGLLILGFDLRNLGTKLWESLALWVWLFIGTVFVFVTNAIGIGTLRIVPAPLNIALCYRKHFLPSALTSSLISIGLELYCLIRLLCLIVPPFLQLRHKLDAVKDIRIARVISLLIFDLLTIVPSGVPTNLLGDFIPYSIGALIVLVAHNHRSRSHEPADMPVTSIPSTLDASIASRPPTVPSTPRRPDRPPPLDFLVHMQGHPFSAESLRDPALQTEQWPRGSRSRSIVTTDNDSVILQSVKGAIVQTAVRRSPQPVVVLPPVPRLPREHMQSHSASGQPQRVLNLNPILPNQAQFARQFEEVEARNQLPHNSQRPKISIVTPESSRSTSFILEDTAVPDAHHGANVMPSNFDRKLLEKMKRMSFAINRISRQTFGSAKGSETSSSDHSVPRYSATSSRHPQPDPERLFAREAEASNSATTPGVRTTTFGETAFIMVGYEPPRTPPTADFTTTSSTATIRGSYAQPSGISRVKGPRPPPPITADPPRSQKATRYGSISVFGP